MRLEELMMLRGFSFRGLSEASGVSLSTIEYLVYGRTTKPYPQTMRAIAQALGVEVNEIDEFAEIIKRRMGKGDPLPIASHQGANSTGVGMPVPSPALQS